MSLMVDIAGLVIVGVLDEYESGSVQKYSSWRVTSVGNSVLRCALLVG